MDMVAARNLKKNHNYEVYCTYEVFSDFVLTCKGQFKGISTRPSKLKHDYCNLSTRKM